MYIFQLFQNCVSKTIKNVKNVSVLLLCWLQNDMLVVVVIYAHPLIMLITVYGNEGRSIKGENDSEEGEEATNTNNDASTLTYHYIYETPMKEQ